MDNPEKLATIGYIKRKQTKQNTICVGHHYTQRNTNNVNKHEPLMLVWIGSGTGVLYHQILTLFSNILRICNRLS